MYQEEITPTKADIVGAANAATTIAALAAVWPMIHAFNLHKSTPVDFAPMMEKRRKEIAASLDNARFAQHFSNREKAIEESERRMTNLSWPEDVAEYHRRQDEAAQEYYGRHYDYMSYSDADPGL